MCQDNFEDIDYLTEERVCGRHIQCSVDLTISVTVQLLFFSVTFIDEENGAEEQTCC